MTWCTGWFDGTWGHCCALHDIAYTLQLDKWSADIALGQCVVRVGGEVMGPIMTLAVLAVGGWAYRNAGHCKLKTTDGEREGP